MAPEDEGKMMFITNQELCSYKVMPFGLKNVRPPTNVYVDDMLVKNFKESQHMADLEETF